VERVQCPGNRQICKKIAPYDADGIVRFCLPAPGAATTVPASVPLSVNRPRATVRQRWLAQRPRQERERSMHDAPQPR
jgi:hypothetical protein